METWKFVAVRSIDTAGQIATNSLEMDRLLIDIIAAATPFAGTALAFADFVSANSFVPLFAPYIPYVPPVSNPSPEATIARQMSRP